MVGVSTTNVESLTILKVLDLTNGFDLNNLLKAKKPKRIPQRKVRLYVTDVDVKDIGPVPVVLPHICASYIKNP